MSGNVGILRGGKPIDIALENQYISVIHGTGGGGVLCRRILFPESFLPTIDAIKVGNVLNVSCFLRIHM